MSGLLIADKGTGSTNVIAMAVGIDDRLDRLVAVSPKSFSRAGRTGRTEESIDDNDAVRADDHRCVRSVKPNSGENVVRNFDNSLLELLLLSIEHPQCRVGFDLRLSAGNSGSQRENAEKTDGLRACTEAE